MNESRAGRQRFNLMNELKPLDCYLRDPAVTDIMATPDESLWVKSLLTLTIRGGFNTDYDDVTWESSDNNVARIFGSGKNVTVNRIGVGQAVITATLTTTGQTAACNVTVLPNRYIIIPAGNIQVDRDVTTPTETEIRFHPSTLEISLTTNNTNASVVREGNKLKITGHKEGQTLLALRRRV